MYLFISPPEPKKILYKKLARNISLQIISIFKADIEVGGGTRNGTGLFFGTPAGKNILKKFSGSTSLQIITTKNVYSHQEWPLTVCAEQGGTIWGGWYHWYHSLFFYDTCRKIFQKKILSEHSTET